jgi:hypothetical protein
MRLPLIVSMDRNGAPVVSLVSEQSTFGNLLGQLACGAKLMANGTAVSLDEKVSRHAIYDTRVLDGRRLGFLRQDITLTYAEPHCGREPAPGEEPDWALEARLYWDAGRREYFMRVTAERAESVTRSRLESLTPTSFRITHYK